jgi:hypothetical protein
MVYALSEASLKRDIYVDIYLFKSASSKILGAHSGVAEDSSLLGCYAVLTAKDVPTFRRILLPSSSGSFSSPLSLDRYTVKTQALRSVGASVPLYLSVRCNMAEGLIFQ